MDHRTATTWVTDFFEAWRAHSPHDAAALFTADAAYHAHPFAAPLRGRQAIEAYWRRSVERQDRVDLRVGRPIVAGDRVAVEWWVNLNEGGVDTASTGTLLLGFQGGACSSVREVWMERPGRVEPYEGWGT